MPFKSKDQAKWMFANKPEMAKEWAGKTKSIKALPEKVGKTPKGFKKSKAHNNGSRKCSMSMYE